MFKTKMKNNIVQNIRQMFKMNKWLLDISYYRLKRESSKLKMKNDIVQKYSTFYYML